MNVCQMKERMNWIFDPLSRLIYFEDGSKAEPNPTGYVWSADTLTPEKIARHKMCFLSLKIRELEQVLIPEKNHAEKFRNQIAAGTFTRESEYAAKLVKIEALEKQLHALREQKEELDK